MPKIIPKEELDAIAAVVRSSQAGVRASEIKNRIDFDLSARALQWRLARLTESGDIRADGTGKGRRYYPTIVSPPSLEPHDALTDKSGIDLSPTGAEVRQLINRPISKRNPIGYNPDFLRRYTPNKTSYLSNEQCAQLAEMGGATGHQQGSGTYVRKIMGRLLIDLSWNSSRLEGNTYSLLETERLLELGEGAEGKATQDAQMILNHKNAIELLSERTAEIGFNRYTICNLHASLSDNLLSDPGAGGRVRLRPVGISGTVFHPLEVPQQINEFFDLVLAKASAIGNPFEQAFFMMVHLPYLQPFEDVNKRVSRLAANIPLIHNGFCPLSFVDVDQRDYTSGILGVYELNRVDYLRDVFVWAYQRSCARYSAIRQSLGEPDPFRLKYRAEIGRFTNEVVCSGMDKGKAARWIAQQANIAIDEADRARFIEMVETELSNLHEGNIARYHVRPNDFQCWRQEWR